MNFAIIENGVVSNIAISEQPLSDNWIAFDGKVGVGDLWDGISFSKAAPDYDAQWTSVRTDRNARLAACDWTQLPDCPLDNTVQTEWAVYRQALRDITDQTDPFNITWPQEP